MQKTSKYCRNINPNVSHKKTTITDTNKKINQPLIPYAV